MTNKTYVIGVGMTAFSKPGTKDGDYPDRQVDDVDIALQHNIGLGGAAVVSIYRRAS
jgi:hypothetical protein